MINVTVQPGAISVYVYSDTESIEAIKAALEILKTQGEDLMSTFVDLKALVTEVKEHLVELSGDMDEVLEKLSGAMTAAEVAEIKSDLTGIRDSIRSEADKVPEPAPEEPPVEEPPVEPPVTP